MLFAGLFLLLARSEIRPHSRVFTKYLQIFDRNTRDITRHWGLPKTAMRAPHIKGGICWPPWEIVVRNRSTTEHDRQNNPPMVFKCWSDQSGGDTQVIGGVSLWSFSTTTIPGHTPRVCQIPLLHDKNVAGCFDSKYEKARNLSVYCQKNRGRRVGLIQEFF